MMLAPGRAEPGGQLCERRKVVSPVLLTEKCQNAFLVEYNKSLSSVVARVRFIPCDAV